VAYPQRSLPGFTSLVGRQQGRVGSSATTSTLMVPTPGCASLSVLWPAVSATFPVSKCRVDPIAVNNSNNPGDNKRMTPPEPLP
jgi:hypothetical protein